MSVALVTEDEEHLPEVRYCPFILRARNRCRRPGRGGGRGGPMRGGRGRGRGA